MCSVALLKSSSTINLVRGRILSCPAGAEAKVLVENEEDRSQLSCCFLRTSAAPPPPIRVDDIVLYTTDHSNEVGYILGVVGSSSPHRDSETLTHRQITLAADERIEIRCGESSVIMNRDGRLIIKGTSIVSRASKINKIKGAAVKIN